MKIQNKQDVIKWLKRLREDHPLSTGKAVLIKDVPYSIRGDVVNVFTDRIIRDRYTGMIEYLESEEVA